MGNFFLLHCLTYICFFGRLYIENIMIFARTITYIGFYLISFLRGVYILHVSALLCVFVRVYYIRYILDNIL